MQNDTKSIKIPQSKRENQKGHEMRMEVEMDEEESY